ncbi:MAG: hypothetical protein RL398_42 [Planctomycetota bacterium]|jgi:hypothetical protein
MKRMTILAVAASLFAGSALFGQQKSQEELAKLRDEKMAHEVFQKANWIFDYEKALEEAKKSKKPIFAYFTRSYAG